MGRKLARTYKNAKNNKHRSYSTVPSPQDSLMFPFVATLTLFPQPYPIATTNLLCHFYKY